MQITQDVLAKYSNKEETGEPQQADDQEFIELDQRSQTEEENSNFDQSLDINEQQK